MPATRQPAPAGEVILYPWTIVKRLRPVSLTANIHYLHHYTRMVAALMLLRELFAEDELWEQNTPIRVNANPAREADIGWWEVLGKIISLAEQQNWFAVNWQVLDEAWASWLVQDDGGTKLATFLNFIPVQLFGFVGEKLFECPPMELLHALLAPEDEINAVSAELLAQVGIERPLDEIWFEADREIAWRLLHTIETYPDQYPEPVRWLPELARWACRRTGNVLLDRHFDAYRDGPWFLWEELDTVKNAWFRAQPVKQALERVWKWVNDDPAHITALARFLMDGGSTDQLNW